MASGKIALADLFKIAEPPGHLAEVVEGLQYFYGSWAEAGRRSGVSADFLRRTAAKGSRYYPTDSDAKKIAQALNKLNERDRRLAVKFGTKFSAHLTPKQTRIIQGTLKTKQGREYFRRQVELYGPKRPARYVGGQYYSKQLMDEYKMRWRLRHLGKRTARTETAIRRMQAKINRLTQRIEKMKSERFK
jgi:hypothetical protein